VPVAPSATAPATSAAVIRPAVFAHIQSHRATRSADALAHLVELGFRPWGDAEGAAARGYLLEEAGFHFLWGEHGWCVGRCQSRIAPRQLPPAPVTPLRTAG
jgi:hypothetical protein